MSAQCSDLQIYLGQKLEWAIIPKFHLGRRQPHQYEESNRLGIEAEQAMQRSLLGQSENPHEAVIAVQKAGISLSLMMVLKND